MLLCFAVVVLAPVAAYAINPVVTFADANLEAAVCSTMGIPSADIHASDLTTLTALSAGSSSITQLDGLQYATSLQSLNLYNNNITTITPIASLASLTILNVSNNHIEDLTPLQTLTSLDWLHVGFNEITTLTPIQNLTGLAYLDADNNDIAALTPLAGLTDLSTLMLYNNDISDVSPLSGMTQLRTLYLGQNSLITSVTALGGLTTLESLDLGYNPIPDISPLATLTNLTLLGLYDNGTLVDISPIGNLTKLNFLNVSVSQIYDISPLLNLNGAAKDTVYLNWNWLDLTPGSTSSAVVQALTDKGYTVHTDGQNYGGAIIGIVRSTARTALGGVTATLLAGPHAHSALNGHYVIGLAKPGVRTITFSKQYYRSRTVTFTVSAGATKTVDATLSPVQLPLTIKRSPAAYSNTYRRSGGHVHFTLSAVFSDARGLVKGKGVYLQSRKPGGSWKNTYVLVTNASGKAARRFTVRTRGTTYYRWYSKATSWDQAKKTSAQKVIVR